MLYLGNNMLTISTTDIDRDVDIQFDGKGGAFSLHPFLLNLSSSTLGLWVRYANRDSTGTFLTVHMVK